MTEVAARPHLLREPPFRSFFVGDAVSQAGDRVSELAFPLIAVLVLHASAAEVSVLTALAWLPNLVSPFLGAWIDRQQHKKRLLVVADLVRAALLLTVPAAFASDALTLLQLYAVALLTGAASVLFNTTYPAFFVLLVRRPDYLAANSLLSGSRSVSFIVGPALGGALVSLVTAPVALVVDALSFLWSAVFVGRVRLHRRPEPPTRAEPTTSLLHEAREGLAYTLGHPVLRAKLGCVSTVNFFTFVFAALLVLFASRELGLSSGLIGLALGIGAVGGLVGAVTAGPLSRRIGVGPSIVVGAVVFPAAIALTAVADGPVWLRAGLIGLSELVSGVGVMYLDVNSNALTATVVPDGLRSRVSGAFAAVNYGMRPLGALTGGALGTWLGIRPTLWVAAVGGTLGALWLLPSPIPRIRTLDGLAPEPARDRT